MTLATGFIERLSEEAIDIIIDSLAAAPSYFWVTAEHYLPGAICRPAPNHARFTYNDGLTPLQCGTVCAN
jgi:hypothetical protein